MKQGGDKTTGAADGTAGVFIRSAVVFAWLASLCISDGIGPRLIPFPSRPRERDAAAERAADAASGSRLSAARAATHAASGHEPKATTPVWNNSSRDRAALSPPAVGPTVPPDLYTSPGYSFRSPASTRGRAPPRNS